MRFRDWNSVDWIGVAILLFVGLCLVAFVVSFSEAIKQDKRRMAECIADGHKEYQCHAMLKNNAQLVPMPVVIPVGR